MSSILSRSLRTCTTLPKTIAPRPSFLAPRLGQGLRLRQGGQSPSSSLGMGMGVRYLSEQPRLRLGSVG